MVAHAFNPSTWEAEAGGFRVQGQPGLQSEFQESQGYKEKPCLEKHQKPNQNKKQNNPSPKRLMGDGAVDRYGGYTRVKI